MKISSIFERAARLSGIAEDYYKSNDSGELPSRALTAINAILFDLCGEAERDHLLDEISVSPAVFDAAVYGTAMYLSLSFGDTDKASVFSKIYNGKRTGIKSATAKITDRLPGAEAKL